MEQFIQDWGYIALFLYTFGGGFVGLAIAGALSYAGDLNIYICVAVATVSNFVGSQFLFFLARKNKTYAKDIMKKYGRKVALTHLIMKKYGSFVIFMQKFIYGVKTLVPLAIGITKYSVIKFTIFNAIASAVWACVIGYISFTAGKFLLSLSEDFKYVGLVAVTAIILIVIFTNKNRK